MSQLLLSNCRHTRTYRASRKCHHRGLAATNTFKVANVNRRPFFAAVAIGDFTSKSYSK
ncbi:unnamed protein product [Trichogramma brassicae]|uniref:Uncharacterized protein n=1 Tax=Trichogramma brassicae TaxID=86971 RepID=A0A6H5IBW2_9HYME|nr:unnamed protein product [Trichogramma brassicae]